MVRRQPKLTGSQSSLNKDGGSISLDGTQDGKRSGRETQTETKTLNEVIRR